jgi:hypothetical protein
MVNNNSYRIRLFIKLIAISVLECFILSSIAPDYSIRSLIGKDEVATRQLIAASIPKAPDFSLTSQFKTNKIIATRQPHTTKATSSLDGNHLIEYTSLQHRQGQADEFVLRGKPIPLKAKADSRQLKFTLRHEAPDCLSPPLKIWGKTEKSSPVENSPRNIGGFWCGQNHNGLSQVKHRVIIEERYSIFKIQKEFPKEDLDGLLVAESFYIVGDKEAIGTYGLTICVGMAGIVKTRGGKNVGFVDHFSVMCDIPASLAEIKGLLMDKYNLTVDEISQMQIYIVGGAYAYAPERIEEIKTALESLGIGKLSIEATGFEVQLFMIDIAKNSISVKGFETKKQGDRIILSDISKILSLFEANMENRKIKKVIVQYGDKVNAEIKPIKGIGEDKQAYNQLVITITNNSPPPLDELIEVVTRAL